jgi:hypothetical protein
MPYFLSIITKSPNKNPNIYMNIYDEENIFSIDFIKLNSQLWSFAIVCNINNITITNIKIKEGLEDTFTEITEYISNYWAVAKLYL